MNTLNKEDNLDLKTDIKDINDDSSFKKLDFSYNVIDQLYLFSQESRDESLIKTKKMSTITIEENKNVKNLDPNNKKSLFVKYNSKRKDAYGNKIIKGEKKHKVSFLDDISKKDLINAVYIVTENDKKIHLNDKPAICEGCLIF